MSSYNWVEEMEKIICEDATEIANKECQLFITLFGCKCCSRHNINKPVQLYAGWKENISSDPNRDTIGECICSCRHLTRMMARQYNEKPWWAFYKQTESKKKINRNSPIRSSSPDWTPGWHNY